jgi:hypothetical protein
MRDLKHGIAEIVGFDLLDAAVHAVGLVSRAAARRLPQSKETLINKGCPRRQRKSD